MCILVARWTFRFGASPSTPLVQDCCLRDDPDRWSRRSCMRVVAIRAADRRALRGPFVLPHRPRFRCLALRQPYSTVRECQRGLQAHPMGFVKCSFAAAERAPPPPSCSSARGCCAAQDVDDVCLIPRPQANNRVVCESAAYGWPGARSSIVASSAQQERRTWSAASHGTLSTRVPTA